MRSCLRRFRCAPRDPRRELRESRRIQRGLRIILSNIRRGLRMSRCIQRRVRCLLRRVRCQLRDVRKISREAISMLWHAAMHSRYSHLSTTTQGFRRFACSPTASQKLLGRRLSVRSTLE